MDSFFSACDHQLEMQHRVGVGLHNHILMHFLEAFRGDGDRVISERHGTEIESSAVAGILGLRPVRVLRLQRDVRALNGTVLRIMNYAANGAENRGICRSSEQQNRKNNKPDSSHKISSSIFRVGAAALGLPSRAQRGGNPGAIQLWRSSATNTPKPFLILGEMVSCEEARGRNRNRRYRWTEAPRPVSGARVQSGD